MNAISLKSQEEIDVMREGGKILAQALAHVESMVRPGITGWAQVQYKYGNTMEDARERLQYDLFYIKNASVGLDFWIVFQTVKIVMLGRGH